MADEDQSQKTEEPTAKKLEDAFKKGQVAKSQEVGHFFMTAGIALAVLTVAAGAGGDLARSLSIFVESPHLFDTDSGILQAAFADLGLNLALTMAPVLGILILAALIGNVIQHRPFVSLERIKPKFSKISLIEGIKRQFSLKALVEFLKGLGKLTLVGAVAVTLIWPQMDRLPLIVSYDPSDILELVQRLSLLMLSGVAAVMAVIAGLDFLYQRYSHIKGLKMSRQEIKDEYKDAEGDPLIKAKLRQLRMERSRRRMMAAVPTADVVITNPTHFAVALKYDGGKMNAPKVVAKGQDLVALRIRKLAEENDVPIVENPPLARALHATADLDREIPVEHYKAVAEVISYIYGLRKKQGTRRPVQ
ncbi:flagellar biosynthesis protein FlhB [Oceanibacterium hippocampi]|uniref:Flagellar biosynthetic protein FlhB n=1 Tax=Oceanibacterium hippocampi TaxID=745714 RepID=A0A1Y5U254_9PROT|nr:flagellar biosynthesis protein FlhB [Oceanibacterium hippocampi]SLN76827.1 Flagellar biosynthetic protein FlhB [Oceanibacterium hippocampi]